MNCKCTNKVVNTERRMHQQHFVVHSNFNFWHSDLIFFMPQKLTMLLVALHLTERFHKIDPFYLIDLSTYRGVANSSKKFQVQKNAWDVTDLLCFVVFLNPKSGKKIKSGLPPHPFFCSNCKKTALFVATSFLEGSFCLYLLIWLFSFD